MQNERTDARRERLHRRVAELLPWYLNGTLDEAERAVVEEHLAGCDRCRAGLPAERDLAEAVAGTGVVAPSPHPVQLARLMARIDAEERRRRPQPGRRLAALARATPRPVRWLVAAQLAAVLLLAVTLARPLAPEAPALFHTLSDAAAAPAAARLSVVFAPGASERQMRDVLAAVRGQIVGGPSPLGVYTVAVPPVEAAGEPLAVVLDHLRSRPEVAFAEPVAGGGGGGGTR